MNKISLRLGEANPAVDNIVDKWRNGDFDYLDDRHDPGIYLF